MDEAMILEMLVDAINYNYEVGSDYENLEELEMLVTGDNDDLKSDVKAELAIDDDADFVDSETWDGILRHAAEVSWYEKGFEDDDDWEEDDKEEE